MKLLMDVKAVVDHRETGAMARKERLKNGLSVREVAQRMGISGAYLCDMEKGYRGWTQEKVDRFIRALA